MTELYGIGFCMGVTQQGSSPITSKQNRGSSISMHLCGASYEERSPPLKGFALININGCSTSYCHFNGAPGNAKL
jgi:hypothetical protein